VEVLEVGDGLVVTNNGTSDLVARAWGIRRGVASVRGLTPSECGVDVQVEVDRIGADGLAHGTTSKVLRRNRGPTARFRTSQVRRNAVERVPLATPQ